MYCSKCGLNIENNNFCSACGEKARQSAQTYTQIEIEPNDFSKMVHKFGGSLLFLIGIVLYTIGYIITTATTFSVFSIFIIPFIALAVVGFCLIYGASQSPRSPKSIKSTLAALVLFKIDVIIGLVGVSAIILSTLFGGTIILIALLVYAEWMAVGIVSGVIFGMLVISILYIVFYFVAFLKVLSGIRNGIRYNKFEKIRGIKSFTIFAYIAIGFGILYSVGMMIFAVQYTEIMQNMLWDLPWYMQDFYLDNMGWAYDPNYIAVWGVGSIAVYAGSVLCLITLNKFNKSIKKPAKII